MLIQTHTHTHTLAIVLLLVVCIILSQYLYGPYNDLHIHEIVFNPDNLLYYIHIFIISMEWFFYASSDYLLCLKEIPVVFVTVFFFAVYAICAILLYILCVYVCVHVSACLCFFFFFCIPFKGGDEFLGIRI